MDNLFKVFLKSPWVWNEMCKKKKQWLSGCDAAAVILECIYCLCLARLSKSSGNVFKFCITSSLTLIKPSFGMTALI